MARAIVASALVAFAKRRSYSTVAVASTAAGKASKGGLKVVDSAASSASPSAYSAGSSSWVPDPLTGYYRPTNQQSGDAAAAATTDSLLSSQHN